MAAPAFAFTISRAAEILGRGRAALVGLSRRDASGERLSLGSMAPRISRRLPSRPAGMEYLRDLLAEHKRNRPPRGTERMVSLRALTHGPNRGVADNLDKAKAAFIGRGMHAAGSPLCQRIADK